MTNNLQEGSFAFVFKSVHFPDEIVATRRGSPLLIGVKTDRKLKVDFVDVELASEEQRGKGIRKHRVGLALTIPAAGDEHHPSGLLTVPTTTNGNQTVAGPKLRRSQSRAFMSDDGMPQPIEFFVASDASAVVEHTKRVLYLEDDDIAHIAEGGELLRPLRPSRMKKLNLQSSTFTDCDGTMVSRPSELSSTLRLSSPRS